MRRILFFIFFYVEMEKLMYGILLGERAHARPRIERERETEREQLRAA
jgi:hypothetical protein